MVSFETQYVFFMCCDLVIKIVGCLCISVSVLRLNDTVKDLVNVLKENKKKKKVK